MAKFTHNGFTFTYAKLNQKATNYKKGYRKWAAISPNGRVLSFICNGTDEDLNFKKNFCRKELGQCDFVELP